MTLITLTSCAPESSNPSKSKAPEWELKDKNKTFCDNATEIRYTDKLQSVGREYVYMEATFSHYGSFDKNQNYSYCLSIKDSNNKERNFLVNKSTYFENDGFICLHDNIIEAAQVCFSHRSNMFKLFWYADTLETIPYDFMDNFLANINDAISEVTVSINKPEKNTIVMEGGLIPEDKLCSRETVGKSCKYPGFVLCKTTPCEAEHCDVFNCKVDEGLRQPGPVD